jgi:predicted dehydrogenase
MLGRRGARAVVSGIARVRSDSRLPETNVPDSRITRRDFVAGGSRLAVGAMVTPASVLASVPRRRRADTLGIAIVGAGGMGTENAQEVVSERIVAVCDVDFGYVERKVEERTRDSDGEPREKGLAWQEQFTRAARYADYRVMLERQPDIDAVIIATPDHAHAAIAKAAMEAGKHVYVQKPLSWSVNEARMLRDVADRTGVVTQMGNQGHSRDDGRRIIEWVRSGVLGTVREVHVWTNRPIWPQGLPNIARPDELPGEDNWWPGSVASRIADMLAREYTPPPTLNWDLYRGPIADEVPWHPIYHPFHWRGWTAFGVGALGDMAAHLLDHPYWALELGYPTRVEATSTPWGGSREAPATYPLATKVHYDFPRRGILPPVRLTWYDGGLMPRRPDALPDDVRLDPTGGAILVGERGVLMHETYGANPRIWPESLREEAEAVPETLPRVEGSHEMNWVEACKGEAVATCPFEYAVPLTEVMLLGIVALRAGQGVPIEYDGARGRVTNHDEANAYLGREYRSGWGL